MSLTPRLFALFAFVALFVFSGPARVHALQINYANDDGLVVTNDSDNAVPTARSERVEALHRRQLRRTLKELDSHFTTNLPEDIRAFIASAKAEADLPLDMTERYPIPVATSGVLAVLLDPLTGSPLAKCTTPCALPGRVGDVLPVILIGGGHLPQMAWHGSDVEAPYLGANYKVTSLSVGQCAAAYDARPPIRPDADAEPCLRLPPYMPPEATRSGHCRVRFDITPDGFVQNLRRLSCTDPVLEGASLFTTGLWFYHPAWSGGQRVTRQNVVSKISFQLTDEHGNIIPE